MPGTGPSSLRSISFNLQQPSRREVLPLVFHLPETRLAAQARAGMPSQVCVTPKASPLTTTLRCLSERKLESHPPKHKNPSLLSLLSRISPLWRVMSHLEPRRFLNPTLLLEQSRHSPPRLGHQRVWLSLGLVTILDIKGKKKQNKNGWEILGQSRASAGVSSGETEITEGVRAERNSLGKLLTI